MVGSDNSIVYSLGVGIGQEAGDRGPPALTGALPTQDKPPPRTRMATGGKGKRNGTSPTHRTERPVTPVFPRPTKRGRPSPIKARQTPNEDEEERRDQRPATDAGKNTRTKQNAQGPHKTRGKREGERPPPHPTSKKNTRKHGRKAGGHRGHGQTRPRPSGLPHTIKGGGIGARCRTFSEHG